VADLHLTPPPDLRRAIADDLRPIDPLAPPLRRALALAPLALLVVLAASAIFGTRRDAPALGILLTWTASIAQLILGIAITAAALREAVPGTTLSRRALGAAVGAALFTTVLLTWVTWLASPTRIRPGLVAYVWSVCLAGTIVGALPLLAAAGWLAARAFPLRPRVAGALCGIGAGLVADAGWRLFCHFSDPVHVLGSHTLAIFLVAVLGAAVARRARPTT
jgi:hypothetical protein